MKKKRIRAIFITTFIFLTIWILAGYFSAAYLTSTRFAIYKPMTWRYNKEDVKITTSDGIQLSAWFMKGNSDKAVILLSGIGANRYSCMLRAEDYIKKGYSVLLPDLRATGESSGSIISFGWNERKDLIACYEYLKKKGIKKIAAHGTSLGAATIIYSLGEIKNYHFIILESSYDNLDQAFANRVNKYHLPDIAYLPVRYFVEKRIDAKIEDLKPEEFIKLARCPALIMAGDAEEQIKLTETEKLFKNCGSPEKSLHIFKNGKHEDFKHTFENEFTRVVNDFISKY